MSGKRKVMPAIPGDGSFLSRYHPNAKLAKKESWGDFPASDDCPMGLNDSFKNTTESAVVAKRTISGDSVNQNPLSLLPRQLVGDADRNQPVSTTSPLSSHCIEAKHFTHPSFAVASTLFQRDHCGQKTIWRGSSALGHPNDNPSLHGVVGAHSPGAIEDGDDMGNEMEKMDDELDEVAWVSNDDGSFADFGNSDFMPTARIQL